MCNSATGRANPVVDQRANGVAGLRKFGHRPLRCDSGYTDVLQHLEILEGLAGTRIEPGFERRHAALTPERDLGQDENVACGTREDTE